MSENPWGPVHPTGWRSLAHLRGRLATQADVEAGRAVFHLDVGAKSSASPAALELPVCGIQSLEGGVKRPVVIIQAEILNGDTIVGLRYLPGGHGVCYLDEVELLDGPEGWLPRGE